MMSNDSYAHPKGNNSRGHLQAWLIEEFEVYTKKDHLLIAIERAMR